MVRLGDKCNIFDLERKKSSEIWFDEIGTFDDEIAEVRLNGNINFINKDFQCISDTWFDFTSGFRCFFSRTEFAAVEIGKKWNHISREGKILFDKWYDFASSFSAGLAFIELDGKFNMINQDGILISDTWFDDERSAIAYRDSLR